MHELRRSLLPRRRRALPGTLLVMPSLGDNGRRCLLLCFGHAMRSLLTAHQFTNLTHLGCDVLQGVRDTKLDIYVDPRAGFLLRYKRLACGMREAILSDLIH